MFINKIRSDLLITCNEHGASSTSKEFFEDYEQRLKFFEDEKASYYGRVVRDKFNGYKRIRSKMHAPGPYTTDIGELDTQVLIILDKELWNTGVRVHVRAHGKADLVIAPEGLLIDGLEYNQRIDLNF